MKFKDNKKIKVLQVVGLMNRGGAEVMLMDIFHNITPNIEFDFLVNYKLKAGITSGQFDKQIKEMGGQIFHIGAQWDVGLIEYIRLFRQYCSENGVPDVVHCHLNSKGGVVSLAAKLCGVKKIIVHSHGDIAFKGNFISRLKGNVELFIQRCLINNFATDYWACSASAAKSLFFNSKMDEVVKINNAIDVKAFTSVEPSVTQTLKSELIGEKNNRLIIGAVGRVVKRKNLSFIIDILEKLSERGKDFLFINVGQEDDSSYMNEVITKVKSKGLEGKVKFFGLRSDIPQIMSLFDVFISPAFNEAFGMVAAEAQAAGCPCILSTQFPEEVDMKLGLVKFIDGFEPDFWALELERFAQTNRPTVEQIEKNFKSLGFDVLHNTREIESLYFNH